MEGIAMSVTLTQYARIVGADFAQSYLGIQETTNSYLFSANALKKSALCACSNQVKAQVKTEAARMAGVIFELKDD